MSSPDAAIVILGASGDLARRKLIPAIAKLFERGQIGEGSVVVGCGRTAFDDDSFRRRFDTTPQFGRRLFYHQGISGLRTFVASRGAFPRVIFFLALPPEAYSSTAAELAHEGFGNEAALIIEKPFGYDDVSARQLNADLTTHFRECQIFRIDHYLAKEAVQNILVFRFANSLFDPVWNGRYVESIQINAFEEIGVVDRGAYFDKAGIIRDMVQNHLMQLLCLLTMEAPVTLDPGDIRAQKIAVLKALRVTGCCRAQYRGYHDEKGVAADSTTETYTEMSLVINNLRWAGTPVWLRAGKALNRKGTEIGVRFKPLPHLLFNDAGTLAPNVIVFKIQPAEGIILSLSSKAPGEMNITGTNMAFCYRDAFEGEIPEAYQKLVLDAIRCDRTLFVSAEETELSWKKVGPVLDKGEVGRYERGSVPPTCLYHDWIDFGGYAGVCT